MERIQDSHLKHIRLEIGLGFNSLQFDTCELHAHWFCEPTLQKNLLFGYLLALRFPKCRFVNGCAAKFAYSLLIYPIMTLAHVEDWAVQVKENPLVDVHGPGCIRCGV